MWLNRTLATLTERFSSLIGRALASNSHLELVDYLRFLAIARQANSLLNGKQSSKAVWLLWIFKSFCSTHFFYFSFSSPCLLEAQYYTPFALPDSFPNLINSLFLEHVYIRPEVNSNPFEISLRGKISLRYEVTSLSAFTWLWGSETHFSANFTSVNLTEMKFQTAVSFRCKK